MNVLVMQSIAITVRIGAIAMKQTFAECVHVYEVPIEQCIYWKPYCSFQCERKLKKIVSRYAQWIQIFITIVASSASKIHQ